MFGCPKSLGGDCCSYGSICASNSQCISTVSASTSSTPLVSQIPVGCTVSQITCAQSLGGGCCAATQSCTLVSGAARCADQLVTPTGSGVALAEESAGLSTAAKAGVSVGVVVGCGLLIGVLTWWCLRRRREKSEMASDPQGPRPTGVIGAVLGSGRVTGDDASEMVSHGAPVPGIARDYFGPDPAAGPYTDFQHSGVSTPRMGVPLRPDGPGDIAAPVEIDSGTPELKTQGTSEVSFAGGTPVPPPPAGETTEQRFELYGSEYLDPNANVSSPVTPVVPSPLSGQSPPHGRSPG
jgi:hypothetical protein